MTTAPVCKVVTSLNIAVESNIDMDDLNAEVFCVSVQFPCKNEEEARLAANALADMLEKHKYICIRPQILIDDGRFVV